MSPKQKNYYDFYVELTSFQDIVSLLHSVDVCA